MYSVGSLGRSIVVVATVLWIASNTSAQPAPTPTAEQRKQANAHLKQGQAFLDNQLYDDALKELQIAFDIAPVPELLFNIAQAYRLKGDNDKALAAYIQYVEKVPDGAQADESRTHIAYLTKAKEAREAAERKQKEDDARAAAAAEQRRQAEAAVALQRQRDEEETARKAAERQKQQAEAAARTAEAERLSRERDDWSKKRAAKADLRHIGYGFVGAGAGALAFTGLFSALGSSENTSIKAGGLPTGSAISDAASTGSSYNDAAYAFGVAGIIGLAIGVPIVLLNLDSGAFQVTPTVNGDVKGLVLSGALP